MKLLPMKTLEKYILVIISHYKKYKIVYFYLKGVIL